MLLVAIKERFIQNPFVGLSVNGKDRGIRKSNVGVLALRKSNSREYDKLAGEFIPDFAVEFKERAILIFCFCSESILAQSNAWNVELVGQIGRACNAVFVQGNYAYIGGGSNLRIFGYK